MRQNTCPTKSGTVNNVIKHIVGLKMDTSENQNTSTTIKNKKIYSLIYNSMHPRRFF